MPAFGGRVLFLDRDDINTDEIIPAKYLTEITKTALGPHCLEDLKLPGFVASRDLSGKGAVVTRANFGCGSSREHAPWALEANGIRVVVAAGYARIFRQNMFNGGLVAATLAKDTLDEVFATFTGRETTLVADLAKMTLTFSAVGVEKVYPFTLGEFEKALVSEGGWVGFANKKY